MALTSTTVTAATRRWGNQYLAQLTRRETYNKTSLNTIDLNVLETAVRAAQETVRQKIGRVAETYFAVIELIPYMLNAPQEEFPFERMTKLLDDLKPAPVPSQSTSIAKGEEGDRRRIDGDDMKDLIDLQRRGRRGTF